MVPQGIAMNSAQEHVPQEASRASLRPQVQALVTALLIYLATVMLPLEDVHLPIDGYVPVHTVLEFISVLISFLVFAIIWSTPSRHVSTSLVIISLSLLSAGILDFLHMMSINGMPDFVTTNDSQKSISFWLAARATVAAGLLSGCIIRKNVAISRTNRIALALLFVGASMATAWMVLFHQRLVPHFFIGGHGTTLLKSSAEVVLVSVFAVAAWRFYVLARSSGEAYYAIMFGAASLSAVGELFFANYLVANDMQNMVGHLYKIVSYWMVFRAMFLLSVRKPYEILSQQTQALREVNEALRVRSLALASTATPVCVTDIHGIIRWRNRAAIALCPGAHDESMSLFDPVLTPDPDERHKMKQALVNGEVWRDLVHLHKDQEHLYLDRTVTPIRSDVGALEGYVAVSENITRNVQTQARHQRVLQTALDGYWLSRADGKFLESNGAFARMTGYSQDELLNMSVYDLASVPEQENIRRYLALAVQNGHARFSCRHIRKDGSILPLDMSVAYDPQSLHCYVFCRDMSEHEQHSMAKQDLERQLQHAQKIQALGQLTGGIAHDFNNILASVLGYANLALSRFAQDKESKLALYLREIVTASERARDLIAKMMTFARTQPVGPMRVISVSQVVQEVIAMLRPSIPTSIQLSCRSDEERSILMEAGELNQVLVNLIINARDAIAGQGRIDIRVRGCKMKGQVCAITHERLFGQYTCIEVGDNGSGIADEHLGSLFDPFFTTKEVGRGTGLGLSVVQGILQKCGGHAIVSSQPGRGSLFQLLFPLVRGSEEVTLAVIGEKRARPGNGQAIWVVDDERAVAGFLGELLDDSGYEVRLFNDPLIALSALRSNHQRIELLISDQTMPGLTGLQLTSHARELRPGLPVIICTGFGEGIDSKDLERYQIDRLFIKPVPAPELLKAIADLLSHHLPAESAQ